LCFCGFDRILLNIFLDKDYFPEHEEQRADPPGCLTRESIERAKQGKRVGVGRTKSADRAVRRTATRAAPSADRLCTNEANLNFAEPSHSVFAERTQFARNEPNFRISENKNNHLAGGPVQFRRALVAAQCSRGTFARRALEKARPARE
jgi:hypothetical protein